MSAAYPIVDHGTLEPVGKRGPLGLGGRERPAGQLPRPLPHQALVLSDGGTYTSSKDRRMGPREDHVIDATGWSLIDMTRDRALSVDVPLQSGEVEKFTLRVTFFCTVTDELTVARSGPPDLTEPLVSYLKGYHRLYQLGLEHAIDAVHKVQDDAQVELGIYTQASPPSFLGIQLHLSSVEVLTPAVVEEERRREEQKLKEYRRKQRELELERELAARQRSYERDDQLDEHKFTRELAREEGETERERLELQARARRLTRDQEREELDFQQEQQQRTMAAHLRLGRMFGQETADDPYAVISYAVARGELDSAELIRRIDEETRRRRELEEHQAQIKAERLTTQLDREWAEQQEARRHERQIAAAQQQIDAKAREREAGLDQERIRLDMEKESRSLQWEVTREERAWEQERDKLRLQHDLALAQQQLETGRTERENEWEKERARLEHERRMREQDLEALREERKWKDDKERQQWEREQSAREQELKVQIAQKLIDRGQGDQTHMADVILSVIQDITNTPRQAEIVEDEAPALESTEAAEPQPEVREEEIGR